MTNDSIWYVYKIESKTLARIVVGIVKKNAATIVAGIVMIKKRHVVKINVTDMAWCWIAEDESNDK